MTDLSDFGAGAPHHTRSDADTHGITVVHVEEPFDTYGARAKGGISMAERDPPYKGWLGNPHTVDGWGRDRAIELFERDYYEKLRDSRDFTNAVLTLVGRRVACWCRAEDDDEPACHLDVVNRSLIDGHVARIAHQIHDIPLTDAESERMCDPGDLL